MQIRCPVCNSLKMVEISPSQLNLKEGLALVSIPAGAVCSHSFSCWMDADLNVRGEQCFDMILGASGRAVGDSEGLSDSDLLLIRNAFEPEQLGDALVACLLSFRVVISIQEDIPLMGELLDRFFSSLLAGRYPCELGVLSPGGRGNERDAENFLDLLSGGIEGKEESVLVDLRKGKTRSKGEAKKLLRSEVGESMVRPLFSTRNIKPTFLSIKSQLRTIHEACIAIKERFGDEISPDDLDEFVRSEGSLGNLTPGWKFFLLDLCERTFGMSVDDGENGVVDRRLDQLLV